MKITINNPCLFETLGDLIPNVDLIPFDFISSQFGTTKYNQLLSMIGDEYSFMYQYVSRSMNKKLSSLSYYLLTLYPLYNYGDFYSLPNLAITNIVKMLDSRYYLKWTKLFETYSLEYNPIKPYDLSISEDSTNSLTASTDINSNSQKSSTEQGVSNVTNDVNENSMYGFNNITPVPIEKNTNISSENSNSTFSNNENKAIGTNYERENPTSKHITRLGNTGNIPQQDLIKKQRDILMYQLWDIIFKDLDSVLTRSKYI